MEQRIWWLLRVMTVYMSSVSILLLMVMINNHKYVNVIILRRRLLSVQSCPILGDSVDQLFLHFPILYGSFNFFMLWLMSALMVSSHPGFSQPR